MCPAKISCEACPVRARSVFSDLSREDLRELTKARTVNTYRKKNIIFYEGNPALGIHCILSGKAKIYKHGMDGYIQIVRLARPGDLLGYRAFFSNEPYAATAEVLEEAEICFMDRATVMRLLSRNVVLCLKILQKVCQDLRSAQERTVDLVQKPVPQRVAELLLSLKNNFGETGADGTRISVNLTREEMAEMAGTRAETLIRILGGFKRRGILDTNGRTVLIRDIQKLEELLPAA